MVLRLAPKSSLDLLCEVALAPGDAAIAQLLTNDACTPSAKSSKKPSNKVLDLDEIVKLNSKQLVKYFTRFESNELRRLFKYTCFLVPSSCQHEATSFGSEAKSLHDIKEHLHIHLKQLVSQNTGRIKFTAETTVPLARRSPDVRSVKKSAGPCRQPPSAPESPPLEIRPGPTSNSQQPQRSAVGAPQPDRGRRRRRGHGLRHGLREHDYARGSCRRPAVPPAEKPAPADGRAVHGPAEPEPEPEPEREPEREPEPEPAVAADGTPPPVSDAHQLAPPADVPAVGAEHVVRSGGGASREMASLTPMPADGVVLPARLPIVIHSGATTVSGLRRYTRVVERDEYKHQRKPKGLAKFISQSEEDKQKAREALSEMRVKQSMCNNYVCRICYPPQRFTALSSLQSHYKSHLGIKAFTCTLCHKSFTRKMSLDYHMLIHAHKTRFRCDSCGHEFRHKSHYTEHLRRHTGETPYICCECGQGFKAKNSYRRHLESKHGQRLTLNGNIVILSDEEHRNLLDRSHEHERSRKRRLHASSPAPQSPSKTGFSLVDVVVRDATGQVEYMCNVDSGSAADTPPPPLLRPPPPDVLRQVVEATVTDQAPPPPPPPHRPPPPPLPRINITSSIGNYDVFYSSGNVANTLYVK